MSRDRSHALGAIDDDEGTAGTGPSTYLEDQTLSVFPRLDHFLQTTTGVARDLASGTSSNQLRPFRIKRTTQLRLSTINSPPVQSHILRRLLSGSLLLAGDQAWPSRPVRYRWASSHDARAWSMMGLSLWRPGVCLEAHLSVSRVNPGGPEDAKYLSSDHSHSRSEVIPLPRFFIVMISYAILTGSAFITSSTPEAKTFALDLQSSVSDALL